jgi:3-hydroxyisobutyrate dehydrogenase-like beta-hydroxyacid dehydrogenase
MKIGFIGLGQMGRPMAQNLSRPKGDYIVCDQKDGALAAFRERGVATTTRLHDLSVADVVFLSLPNGEAVKSVLLGEAGLAARLRPGSIVVDTSTITYAATVEVSEALALNGVEFVDAPVSGMEARAIDATLTIMCGGSDPIFAKVEPLLRRMGDKVLFMGPAGSGQLTKLINQLLFDINAAALAEILPMAVKMGLNPKGVAAVVNSGTGRSYASEFFLPRVLEGEFTAGYPMRAAYKDLVSGAEISAHHGIPMPVLAAATATYQQALLKGLGELDKGSMIQVFEELLNVRFRVRAQAFN